MLEYNITTHNHTHMSPLHAQGMAPNYPIYLTLPYYFSNELSIY